MVPKTPSKEYKCEYEQESEKYIYRDESNVVFEWDDQKHAWFPRFDEELIKQQQSVYKVEGVDENEQVLAPGLKRKLEKQQGVKEKKQKPQSQKKNTAVFVTELPLDTSVDEIHETFSKYGVILEDAATGEPKIKMYSNDQGEFNGSALVIYFKEESVQLACELLDDADFRWGKPSKISVEPAIFKEQPSKTNNQKSKANVQKMSQKLDWNENENDQSHSTKQTRTVILKNMFTLDEITQDPGLIIEIKQDVRSECEKLGSVSNIVLFDTHDEGVISVRFREQESAVLCVRKMNGRYFGGKTVQAYIYDGKEKFVQKRLDLDDEEERLENYSTWIESQQ